MNDRPNTVIPGVRCVSSNISTGMLAWISERRSRRSTGNPRPKPIVRGSRICSSDDEYAALIPEAVKELDDRAELVLAGPETDEFKAMGMTNFINVRTNVLATLKAFNAKLLK